MLQYNNICLDFLFLNCSLSYQIVGNTNREAFEKNIPLQLFVSRVTSNVFVNMVKILHLSPPVLVCFQFIEAVPTLFLTGRKKGARIKAFSGFILKIREQIPKFSQTFFKDFYRLLPGKYLKRLQKEWLEKGYLD